MSRLVQRLVGAVLVESAAGRPLEARLAQRLRQLAVPDVEALLLAAARHGVTGLVGAAVEGVPQLAADISELVERASRRVLRDHLRALGELAVVGEHLGAAGVPWLLVKGPALATVAYREPHLREYTDLDVLVPEHRVMDALATLGGAGFAVDGPALPYLRSIGAGEIRLRSPAGLPVDLHWDVVNDPDVRAALSVPDGDELLGRTRTVELAGLQVRTLDPVDTVLHVALHACTSGGWRLLWLRDVLEAARAAEPWAEDVRARADRWGAALVVASMQERAARVLRTPVPDITGRSDQSWLRLLAAVDTVVAVERTTGRPSVTRIVTRSTRRDSASSLAELVRRSAHFARDAARRRRDGLDLRPR